MEKKMYAVNPVVKLPQNLLLSNVMHNVNSKLSLPDNIKETYYENAKPHLCHKKLVKSESASELIVRQEKILETLQKIKEKLINLQQDQTSYMPSVISSTKTTLKTHVPDADIKSLGEKGQEDILEHLSLLKDELQLGSKRNIAFENEKFQELSEKHNFVFEIIHALQNLLKSEIPLLQDDNSKKMPSDICLHEHHAEVLQLISKLKNEFELILDAINAVKDEDDDLNLCNRHVHPLESRELYSDNASFAIGQKFLKGGVIQDIVVCANSSHPPYFLLALKNLLGPQLNICLSSAIHSLSAQVDLNIFNLFENKTLRDRSDFDVAFTVIWKNQKYKTLMVNPLSHCVISGEGNILRYLSRLSPNLSSLNYESGDLSDVAEVDYWLDLIQIKLLHGNNKEQQSVLKQLNSKLGSSEWLNGRQFGVCDIFLWSALKQLDLYGSSTLPSNVGSWMKRISKLTEFDLGENSEV